MNAHSASVEYASLGGSAGSLSSVPNLHQLQDHCRTFPPLSTPHYRRRIGQLYCMTGFLLNIHHNGHVEGNLKDNDPLGVLEFISVAFGLVSIKGKISNNYLCMDRRGKVFASANQTVECIFKETMLETYYNNYASCAYSGANKPWYLSISRRGKARRGKRAQRRRLPRRTHFLVMLLDDAKLDMDSLLSRASSRNRTRADSSLVVRNSRFGAEQALRQWRQFFLRSTSRSTKLNYGRRRQGW